MRKLSGLLILLLLIFHQPSSAQENTFNGLLLIQALEIGVAEQPNHLYLAEVGTGKVAEILVENQRVFAPWVGWSRDGLKWAYLAPARSGDNFELWLADANVTAPVPRTPLFNLDLNVLAADWNPQFNIIAVTTESPSVRDGLYLVNAEFENIVFLREEDTPRNGILDWAHDGYWLAYSTEEGAVNMINTQSEAVVTLRRFTQPRPALLPSTPTGWTWDDSYYIFSDDIYQNLYAVTTDGNSVPAFFTDDFTADPFSLQLLPSSNRLIALYDTTAYISDLDGDTQTSLTINTSNILEPTYFLLNNGTLLLNSFIRLAEGDFAECLLMDTSTGTVQFAREVLGATTWTHTRCQALEGGAYFALMASDDVIPYDNLPDDTTYDLYIIASDLGQQAFISNTYQGFDLAPLGFSARRGQVVFRSGASLMIYDLLGHSKSLVSLQDLNLRTEFVNFTFYWQP